MSSGNNIERIVLRCLISLSRWFWRKLNSGNFSQSGNYVTEELPRIWGLEKCIYPWVNEEGHVEISPGLVVIGRILFWHIFRMKCKGDKFMRSYIWRNYFVERAFFRNSSLSWKQFVLNLILLRSIIIFRFQFHRICGQFFRDDFFSVFQVLHVSFVNNFASIV